MVVGVTTATTENCFFFEDFIGTVAAVTVATVAVVADATVVTVATGSSTGIAFALVAFALVVLVAFVLAGSATGTGAATGAGAGEGATGAAGAATRDATATAFLRLGTVRASISRIEVTSSFKLVAVSRGLNQGLLGFCNGDCTSRLLV